MMNLRFLFLLLLSCFIMACETEPGQPNNGIASSSMEDSSGPKKDSLISSPVQAAPNLQDCEISPVHFEKNVFLASDATQIIAIIADERTKDANLGDSHRLLQVYNAKNCKILLEEELAVNRSPDFPYYLVPSTYDFDQQVVAIQGFNHFYLYAVEEQKLIGPVKPNVADGANAVDAQSGMVKGLSLWKNYLLGHAIDFGNFAYDLSDINNIQPIQPSAVYQIPNTTALNYLFFLEADGQNYQAIIPIQDLDAGGNVFDIKELFQEPLPINPQVASNVRDNRYILLNQKTANTKVVIDMFNRNQVTLPADLADQSTQKILSWLKANN